MTINFNWKQILMVACNVLVGIYLVLAVTAFNNPDEAMAKECTEVKIDIEEESMEGFLNPGEVKKLLSQHKLYPLSQPMNAISSRKIEETLLKSPFVEKAECYKTLSGHVCIMIKQRIPVVRIMAANGDNYYLDNHGNIMPESGYATDILVATGNITKRYAQNALSKVANEIVSNSFWRNQTVQLNVLPNQTLEMVPRVGDHIVFLGSPNNIENKLERLRKFYIYGLNKAGWNFIVAIELGSSKVTGIAGQKNLDGSINVLAMVKEESSSFIRKGVVYNIDKTAQCLTSIIKKLENQLKTQITQVYVGVGGQSIRSVKNVVTKDLPGETIITQEMVIELMDANRNMTYPDQEILDAAVQEYKVGTQFQLDPVGIQATHLEGHFLNILERKAFYRNLNKCFETAGISVAEMYLAPLALADSVLTEVEKRSGCALVDIGYDTTTVSVYSKNILRHLAVIPLGSNNITKDIASLQMEESDAERMKLKYGSAYTENNEIDNELKYSIDPERQVESRKFIEIVEGRLEEIIENVWYQIPSEYYDKLLGGIILTGGGSNMKNIEKAFINHTHVDKIRIAKFVTQTINTSNEEIKSRNSMMNTVLGLLAKGDINCAGDAYDPNGNLFPEFKPASHPTNDQRPARQATDIPAGVIRTEAEKQKAEEERRRLQEEEERARQEEERLKKEEEARIRKENSIWNKAIRGIKKFGKTIVEEED